jgi:hypothetical protein
VQGQAAAVVDELVPHPEPALLRLAEVVRVEDARHPQVEVDADEAVVGVALRLQVGRVDDGQLGLVVGVVGVEVELLLHAGDIRVGRLDVEPGRHAEVRVDADPTVDLDHLLPGDVGVLHVRPLLRLFAGDCPLRSVGLVRDEER